MKLKAVLFLAILLGAFAWGYQKDRIQERLGEWKRESGKNAGEENAGTAGEPQADQAAVPQPPAPGAAIPQVTPRTLAGTLDSIRPGAPQEEAKVQRNAYFEKLSQQLRELRGQGAVTEGPPPPAPAAESPNATPQPELRPSFAPPPFDSAVGEEAELPPPGADYDALTSQDQYQLEEELDRVLEEEAIQGELEDTDVLFDE